MTIRITKGGRWFAGAVLSPGEVLELRGANQTANADGSAAIYHYASGVGENVSTSTGVLREYLP